MVRLRPNLDLCAPAATIELMCWMWRGLLVVWALTNAVLILGTEGRTKMLAHLSMTIFCTVILISGLLTDPRIRRFADQFTKQPQSTRRSREG